MIYVIGPEESTIVKIGHTTGQPSFRLGNLQIGNPEQLVVRWACEGDQVLEKHLHAVFGDYWVRGEWFDLAPLGDPVQAVKDEARKAHKRLAGGAELLAPARFRGAPLVGLKAFDKSPHEAAWDGDRPPILRGHAVFPEVPPQNFRSRDERFPPARQR